MSSMTGPPSLMSGNTVRKVTKMSSTARMWIRSRLFLRWTNVWDSLSISATKRGPGPSSLESILGRALLALCDGGLFQEQGGPSLGGSCLSLVHVDFPPSPGARHVDGHTRDNGPPSTPARGVNCVFVHHCALVPAFHKGVITIISTPLELRYPCKITEISHFTRRSIVKVHLLSYLSVPE